MNKWVGAGLIGLGVVALGGPYLSGKEAQAHYHQMVGYLNQQSGVTVVTESYDHGYFGSDAVTFVRVDRAGIDSDESQEVRLNTHFSHGVYSVKAISHIVFDEASAADVKKVFGDQPPLELTTTVNVLGDARIEATTPEVDFTDPESGETIELSEFSATADVPAGFQQVSVDVNWPGMKVSGVDGDTVVIGDLSIQQSGSQLTDYLWVSDMEMSLDSVVAAEQGKRVELKALKLNSVTEEGEKGRIDSGFELTIDSFNLNGETFSDQKLVFAMEGISTSELDALIAGLETLEAANQISDPQQQAMAQMEQMALISDGVAALLGKGMKIAIPELFLGTPKGNVNGKLELEQPETVPSGATGQPTLLMQSTKGSFSFQVPVELIDSGSPEMQQQLKMLITQNLVVKDGNVYKTNATLADMMVNVNGTEFPLPPLM